jgi:DNA mismatch repair protein MutL
MIRMLDDAIINRIAAGEVVERPSSVLKELVENALDAEARHLSVALRQGGVGLLQVSDDGLGMSRDDALMSVERHATSKLRQVEDLDHLRTMGFRGEALASIASVSRFELLTRARGAESGVRLRLEGGRLEGVSEAGAPEGTRVTVRDLFYNVPARRKFLRSEPTELQHCEDALKRVLLIRPEVSGELLVDGRPRLLAPRVADRLSRAQALLGAAARGLLVWQDQREDYEIDALLSPVGEHTAANQAQIWLYVNGRAVRDGLLRRAVTEAYQAVTPRFRAPTVVLELRLPPEDVDVNVHPAKTEVRFREGRNVVERVGRSLQAALSQGGAHVGLPALGAAWSQSTATGAQQALGLGGAGPAGEGAPSTGATTPIPTSISPTGDRGGPLNFDPQQFGDPPQRPDSQPHPWVSQPQLIESSPPRSEALPQPLYTAAQPAWPAESVAGPGADRARARSPMAEPRPSWAPHRAPATFVEPVAEVEPAPSPRPATGALRYQDLRLLGQVGQRYVLAEGPQGLVIIDQHVIGVRLVRAQLRAGAEQGRPGRPLLSPRVLQLSPAALARWSRLDEQLRAIGVELEPFGAGSLILKQLPLALSGLDPEALMQGLLDEKGPDEGLPMSALIDRVASAAVPEAQARSVYELREVFKRYDAVIGGRPGEEPEVSAAVSEPELGRMLRGARP